MRKSLIVGLVLVLFGMPVLASDAAHDKTDRTLTVQGQGKVSAVPDIATLSVEVSHDGADLDPVLVQVRQEMKKILEVVKSLGIEDKDVRTDMFQVRPRYEQDKRNNRHPNGYVVSNQISVKVRDLKKTGKVLTAVLNAGATNVDGPRFEIDSPSVIERQALAAATKDAKDKAQAVADAAGVQLGDIISINPQVMNWPGPVHPFFARSMALSAAASDAAEPVSSGEQTLTGSVTLTYLIR